MDNLRSISINELMNGFNNKKICFVVPSYQRGYRWEPIQVTKLLDDLYEFYTLKSQNNSYYCLQPIIVKELTASDVSKKMGEKYSINSDSLYYEIVDGQQRMTTLFVLLKIILRDSDPFDIEYERDQFVGFLRKKLLYGLPNTFKDKSSSTCADEYYILQTFEIIKEWFKNTKLKTGNNALMSNMEDIVCNSTKVIWYELEPNADCYSVFKNINNGKIPLTDAELVKAMLLNAKHFSNSVNYNEKMVKQEQDRYARLWDEIQKELSDDRLWSFITGGASLDIPTRIDFLIQLIVKANDSDYQGEGDHKFFSYFEKKLNDAADKKSYIEDVFNQLKDCFRTIQDWNDDYKLFNYIGYILTYTSTSKNDVNARVSKIIELQGEYNKRSKIDFVNYLIENIRRSFKEMSLETVNYEDNGKHIERLLMLFNIEELNEIHMKFNFTINDTAWSIEHIKAQHSEIAKDDDRKEYMKKEKDSLIQKRETTNDSNLINSIDSFIQKIDDYLKKSNPSDDDFTILAEQIDNKIDGFDYITMHKLGNLALLPLSDNSSFSNNPFYEKRNMMNTWLQDPNKNIPYSTSRAFHKMYSKQVYKLDFTRWTKQDFDDMFSKQKELLKIDDQNVEHKGFIKEM